VIRLLLVFLLGVAVGVIVMERAWPSTPQPSTLPSASDVRVSISDGYLSRRVQARLPSSGIVSISAAHVGSAPPVLVVDAQAHLGPISTPISMSLQPCPSRGDIQVRIVSTHVGIIPIPGFLTGSVAGSINDSLSHALGTDLMVTGVTVTPQGLEVSANYPQ
jgi:hypothetical protein